MSQLNNSRGLRSIFEIHTSLFAATLGVHSGSHAYTEISFVLIDFLSVVVLFMMYVHKCRYRPVCVPSALRQPARQGVSLFMAPFWLKAFFGMNNGTEGNSHISTIGRSVGHSVILRFEPFIITIYVKKIYSIVTMVY
jgi:hypothetical protein